MKKYLLILIAIPMLGFSQTYREAFEATEPLIGNGNSFSTNFSAPETYTLHQTERIYLDAFLSMYNTSKDIKWLDKFIIHTIRIQHHRDDQIQYFSSEVAGTSCQPQLSAVPVNNAPVWSSVKSDCSGYVAEIIHTALISYTMAQFVHLVLDEEPNLQSNVLPVEAIGYEPYPFQYYNLQTYNDFAVYLKNRIEQSVDYLNTYYWCDNTNGYKGTLNQDCGSNDYLKNNVINKQCAMGKLLAEMYLIENASGNSTLAQQYLEKATKIASIVRGELEPNINDASSYTWYYHINQDDCFEDIQHAFLLMGFADLCYQKNIPDFNNQSNKLFFSTDMQIFANTFSKHIYKNPLSFAENTFGQGTLCNPDNTFNPAEATYFYLFLSQYDPDIYQIISDVFCDRAIYGNSVYPAFAFLAEKENLFNPLAVNRCTFVDANWAGVAGGDFDGDGTQEFCTVRNKDGSIEIYNLDPADNHINQRAYATFGNTPWAGIAAVDLDGVVGDEIAAISNNDGNLYLYKQNNVVTNQIDQIENINTNITGWTGIASGNFDGNPGNEIILSNDNGNVYVYRYNGTTIVADAINSGNNFINSNLAGITVGNFDSNPGDEIATINNSSNGNIEITIYNFANSTLVQLSIFTAAAGDYSDWNGITSGDFDGDGIDEIIAHRNYDGDFFIFKLNESAQIVNNYKESFPTNQLNGIIGSARFSIDPTKDALISLRNYDGNMFIYNLEGLCQSLSLNNITINDAYTIDNPYGPSNNYTVDYHANKTLTASNFVIESGSNVTFTAGKKIIVTSGVNGSAAYSGCSFHAYIDEGIACTTPTFRTNPHANNTANNIIQPNKIDSLKKQDSSKTSAKNNLPGDTTNNIIGNTYISVFPNPNNGNMQVSYEIPVNETVLLEIYDMFGKKLLNYTLYSGKNTFAISATSLKEGIYFYRATAGNKQIAADKLVVIP